MTFTRNQLDPADPYASKTSVAPLIGNTGHEVQVDIPAHLCLRSIGYQSLPLPGLEEDLHVKFDMKKGIIPNDGQGRVTASYETQLEDSSVESSTTHLPGLYCAGWVKRGPTGVIASTMTDAFATADAIAADWTAHTSGGTAQGPPFLNSATTSERGSTGLGWDGVRLEAEKFGIRPTSWADWEAIDVQERRRGEDKGKLREKFGRVEEMLKVLG